MTDSVTAIAGNFLDDKSLQLGINSDRFPSVMLNRNVYSVRFVNEFHLVPFVKLTEGNLLPVVVKARTALCHKQLLLYKAYRHHTDRIHGRRMKEYRWSKFP